jgi:hypothetical protein
MPPTRSQPQSGLRTVPRNWSPNDAHSSSQPLPCADPDPIDWPPSPKRPTTQPKREAPRELSSYEKRLRAIQEGLDDNLKSSQVLLSSNAANTAQRQKRTSDGATERPAKKRVLPDSFSNLTHAPPAGNSSVSRSLASTSKITKADAKAAEKPAKVFLSQEQLQILNLVEQGQSVFYTGSAGELPFHPATEPVYLTHLFIDIFQRV